LKHDDVEGLILSAQFPSILNNQTKSYSLETIGEIRFDVTDTYRCQYFLLWKL